MATNLTFEDKKGTCYTVPLSVLIAADKEYKERDSNESLYYVLEEAIRLLTLRYSQSARSLRECGYVLQEKSSEGGYSSIVTTPEEHQEFLRQTLEWAESLTPRELRKSLCSLSNPRQGKRLTQITKGEESVPV